MAETVIRIKANADEAKKTLKDLGYEFKEVGNTAKKAASIGEIAFGSFLGNLATSAVKNAFSSFTNFFKDSIKASGEAEASLNEFNTALALSGKYTQQASEDFQKFASSIEQTTIYGDDAILKNAALIQSLGKLSNEGLKEATKAAVQLASTYRIDLSQASLLIAKAATGNIDVLSRYGIKINETGDKGKDFATLLKKINDEFGGTAESKINTYEGALAQLNEVYGNTQEALGDLITKNPIVIAGVQALKDIFVSLKDILQDNQKYFNDLISGGFTYFLGLIPKIVSGVAIINESFAGLSSVMNLALIGFYKIQRSIYQYSASVYDAAGAVKKFLGQDDSNYKTLAENTRKSIGEVTGQIEVEWQKAAKKITDAKTFTKISESLSTSVETAIKKRIDKAASASGEGKEKYLNNLSQNNAKKSTGSSGTTSKRGLNFSSTEEEEKFWEEMRWANRDEINRLEEERKKNLDDAFERVNKQDKQKKEDIASSIGVASSVFQGKSGVTGLITTGISSFLGPEIGGALSPIFQALSQGPDAVRGMIKEFAAAVPDVITAIVESIPVVIQELVDQAPKIITALVQRAPDLINSLVMQAPYIAMSLIEGIVQNIPYLVGSLGSALFNVVMDLFNNLNPFSSDGFLGGLFAEGGQGFVKSVPSGFPNDSFPARLTSGELVIDRSTAGELKSFLASSQEREGLSTAILSKILNAVSAPISVESSVELNGKTFADIIVQLNRTNQRLA